MKASMLERIDDYYVTVKPVIRLVDGEWSRLDWLKLRDDLVSVQYVTSGGNCWTVCPNENRLYFEGSRGSFEHGCGWGGVYKRPRDGRLRVDTHHGVFFAILTSWETTVPGNPDPFADWQKALEDHEALHGPLTVAEILQEEFDENLYM